MQPNERRLPISDQNGCRLPESVGASCNHTAGAYIDRPVAAAGLCEQRPAGKNIPSLALDAGFSERSRPCVKPVLSSVSLLQPS